MHLLYTFNKTQQTFLSRTTVSTSLIQPCLNQLVAHVSCMTSSQYDSTYVGIRPAPVIGNPPPTMLAGRRYIVRGSCFKLFEPCQQPSSFVWMSLTSVTSLTSRTISSGGVSSCVFHPPTLLRFEDIMALYAAMWGTIHPSVWISLPGGAPELHT